LTKILAHPLSFLSKAHQSPAIRRYKPNKWSLNHDVKTTNPNDRILGGENVDIANHPHQLSLQWLGFHICGAIIISQRWALSAAHCFLDNDLPSDVTDNDNSGVFFVGIMCIFSFSVSHACWQFPT
jgi:hypothetical protein